MEFIFVGMLGGFWLGYFFAMIVRFVRERKYPPKRIEKYQRRRFKNF